MAFSWALGARTLDVFSIILFQAIGQSRNQFNFLEVDLFRVQCLFVIPLYVNCSRLGSQMFANIILAHAVKYRMN